MRRPVPKFIGLPPVSACRAITSTAPGTNRIYQTLPPLIERMREGGGPVLIEAEVVRLESHSSSDDQTKYRSEEEMARARERDPIAADRNVPAQAPHHVAATRSSKLRADIQSRSEHGRR